MSAPPSPEEKRYLLAEGDRDEDELVKEPESPGIELEEITLAEPGLDLDGMSRSELVADAVAFCERAGLMEHVKDFRHGALLAYGDTTNLTMAERRALQREKTHKWDQPFMVYYIAICAAMAAVVQGMDEAVVNGAQIFYYDYFGISNPNNDQTIAMIQGLINSAPYLCCFLLSCWLTEPLNHRLGRRGTIFFACVVTGLFSLLEASTQTWQQLFVVRLILGIGIGPKSATAPVFAAECAPSRIRGALVMQWQMWTAFGIALGDLVSYLFVNSNPATAWRYILGSTCIAPAIVCCMIFLAPESPRWCMLHNRPRDAYKAMLRLRRVPLQAARDIYIMERQLAAEREMQRGGWKRMVRDLFMVGRVRRAAIPSGILMFLQQFCGVNVIAYYSSQIFVEGGFSRQAAMLTTLGTGVVNWLFAIPAIYTIDTFGRRSLLLFTFPFMSVCLLITGFGFTLPEGTGRLGVVASGLYLFMVFYSPGEGPVPFTYSAEAFPLYIRDFGMSYATAVCWAFNFVLAITFPPMLASFKPLGAFSWYAGWCLAGWVLVFLFVPETKARSLEELDVVFSVPTGQHASWQVRNAMQKLGLRQSQRPLKPLYDLDDGA
ncbi:hypothetical protein EXIGLDRAFT_841040 [Exidia glandulosa HHB12029]|uniref:Major facilitator superfamily (MFS) profile domain-containing protein n=1 Tax=Exidia glandulosa HHB12029 TaxID=1314781 RepID=A0A165E536_EXIGL|nr:hypothetical protein EXIGLDRAFT_841040 [Exidia glandulosa HHB12029]